MTRDDAMISAVRNALDAAGLSEFCADGENADAFLDALQTAGYMVFAAPRRLASEPDITKARAEANRLILDMRGEAANKRAEADASPYPSIKRKAVRDAECMEGDAEAIRALIDHIDRLK